MIELGISKYLKEGWAKIENEDRYKHLFCIGETGRGKTTFFLNLINEEYEDNCLIILDPYGELALKSASLIPKDRLIYVDKFHPICLNPLDKSYLNRSELAQEFSALINMMVETINDEQMMLTVLMREILINAIQVINDKNLNIEYLKKLLEEKQERLKYSHIPYWKRFDNTERGEHNERVESAKRVVNRISNLYDDENLKPFLIGKNSFDLPDLISKKKVIVFNFAGLDDLEMSFIGGLITTSIKSYWQHQSKFDSPPLHVYIDEFHLFMTKDFGRFLTSTRKYNISMNFSCHSLFQVDDVLANLILSSYAIVVLGVLPEDAEILSKNMGIDFKKLMNIEKYYCYASVGRKPFYLLCYPPPKVEDYIPEDISIKSEKYSFLSPDWIMI